MVSTALTSEVIRPNAPATGLGPQGSAQVKELNDFSEQVDQFVQNAGTLKLTQKQIEILYAPVNEEDVEIRPDGLIYLPWMEYVTRLRNAFGLSWAMVPQGKPKVQGNHVVCGYHLVIDGRWAGFAYGECEYQPNNKTMTYGDVLEGVKSNALMRLCKGLGISLELWKPSFVRSWKEKYAETYEGKNWKDEKRILWRRKAYPSFSKPETKSVKPETNPVPTSADEFVREMEGNIKELEGTENTNQDEINKIFGEVLEEAAKEGVTIQSDLVPEDHAVEKLTPGQIRIIKARLTKSNITEVPLRKHFCVENISDIPHTKYNEILKWIDNFCKP